MEPEKIKPVIHKGDFVVLKKGKFPWNMGVTYHINGKYIFLNYGRKDKIYLSGLNIPESVEDIEEVWEYKKDKLIVWKIKNNVWSKSVRYYLIEEDEIGEK